MGTLNDLTIEKRETIKSAAYNHVSTYECQLTKNKDFQKFAKNFTQEIVEPLNPRIPFMVEEQMQPNSYTNSKKTNVAITSTFALCIPLFSTTKNIQLVTLPKYITLKNIASLGMV